MEQIKFQVRSSAPKLNFHANPCRLCIQEKKLDGRNIAKYVLQYTFKKRIGQLTRTKRIEKTK